MNKMIIIWIHYVVQKVTIFFYIKKKVPPLSFSLHFLLSLILKVPQEKEEKVNMRVQVCQIDTNHFNFLFFVACGFPDIFKNKLCFEVLKYKMKTFNTFFGLPKIKGIFYLNFITLSAVSQNSLILKQTKKIAVFFRQTKKKKKKNNLSFFSTKVY